MCHLPKGKNMKFIIAVLWLILLLSVTSLFSQDVSVSRNQMIVYGTGSLDAPANRAYINFTVKGFGSSIQAAVEIARKKASDIASKLFGLGLKESNLYTSQFNSGDNFEGKAFLSSSRDFRGQIDVTVTVDSLQLLEAVVAVLASSPVERLSNINFALQSDSTMKLEVRRLAVANAQEKAKLMANQLGVTLGKALDVEELLSYSDGDFYLPPRERPANFIPYQANTVGVAGANVAFYAQRFSVRSGVRIVFEITNAK
jgi:hypothetical protein